MIKGLARLRAWGVAGGLVSGVCLGAACDGGYARMTFKKSAQRQWEPAIFILLDRTSSTLSGAGARPCGARRSTASTDAAVQLALKTAPAVRNSK